MDSDLSSATNAVRPSNGKEPLWSLHKFTLYKINLWCSFCILKSWLLFSNWINKKNSSEFHPAIAAVYDGRVLHPTVHNVPVVNEHVPVVGVGDTLSDSIQFFEFCQIDSFNIRFNVALPKTQFKILFNSKKNLLIQFKRWFNSLARESLILVGWEKCPKIT